ncbi:tetratricopeptide repeat protein [Balneolales bacterium ANBcel1]|nr:tetratricopeptide repeat protein [Balneolales bacterium ANBcel1]
MAVLLAMIVTGSADSNRALEANRAYEAGHYEQAEAIYRELLEDQPGDARLLFNLGSALARQGKTEAAMDVFEQYRNSADSSEERAPAEYNLGYLHEQAGNTEEAMNRFRRALDLDPSDEDAKYNYELLRRRQQETPPDQDDDDRQDEEEQQQPEPEAGQTPEQDDASGEQDQQPDQQPTPAEGSPDQEDQPDGSPPEISREQLDHAEDIMNALEQIEKDLIKDFKKRQFDPVDPHEKDW